MHDDFMNEAIAEAAAGVAAGEGGPFGAVVVKNGRVVARGHNQVVAHGDPTAHAEVQAIRAACRELGSFDLSGCEIYATCEPCPMCFAAIHWARLDRVRFGATRADAAAVGIRRRRHLPGAGRRGRAGIQGRGRGGGGGLPDGDAEVAG